MFYPPLRPGSRRSSFMVGALALSVMLMIAACAASAHAQSGGIDADPGDRGTGGRNIIQGSIYLPGGRRLDRRAKVKLQSMTSGEQFQFSDDNGQFIFRRLAGGSYSLIVEAGNEFEIARETIDIIDPVRRRNDSGITIPVHITLQPKARASTGVIGTVDASSATIPEQARELYKKAVESSQAGDRKNAIEQLKQAVALYPNFMTALNELAVQYIALGQFDKAIESLRAALKISPDAFHPRLNYGIALLQTKNFKEAAQELRRAVEKDSSSAIAHLYLGRALINLNSYGSAEIELQKAISIGGSDVVEAHRYLGVVYIEKQDSKRAADELEQYLKLAPNVKDAAKIRQIVKQLRDQTTSNRE